MNIEIDAEKLLEEIETEETEMLPEFVEKQIEELVNMEMEEFQYQIQQRGKEYYEKGNVKSLVRTGDTFIAKVEGSEMYNVKVHIDTEGDYVHYQCDCPYEWPCKHEYAVLMAILNKDYSAVELKQEIKKHNLTTEELIKLIPAEELKNYILSPIGKDYVCFEIEHLEESFAKYIPIQSYEYYYNNLYNALTIEGYETRLLNDYLRSLKTIINSKKYVEAFSIIRAIIEATNDTGHLDKWDSLIDAFPVIGMHLRIVYRKSSNELRNAIDKWINKLETNDYHNNIYLEDIILTIK